MAIQIIEVQDCETFINLIVERLSEKIIQKNKPIQVDRLISKEELSNLLDISFSSIERMIREKQINSYRIRGRVKFKYSEIISFVDSSIINFT